MQIIIQIEDNGNLNINIDEETPVVFVVGILEAAKYILINNINQEGVTSEITPNEVL